MNYNEYLQRMLDAPSMKYSEYLQLMLDAALDIKAGNFNNRYGICGNIDHKVAYARAVKFPEYVIDDDLTMYSPRILKQAFYTWPKFSGDVRFPINDPRNKVSAHRVYEYDELPKWTGAYGALRFELLDHVIDFLKNGPRAR